MNRFSYSFSTPLLICLVFLFRLSFTSFFPGPVNPISLNGSHLKAVGLTSVKKRRRNLHPQSISLRSAMPSIYQIAEAIPAKIRVCLLKKINPLTLSFLKTAPLKAFLHIPRPPGFFDLFLVKQPSPISLSILRV